MLLIEYTCRDCGGQHAVEMDENAPTFRVDGCPDGASPNADPVEPVPLPVDLP